MVRAHRFLKARQRACRIETIPPENPYGSLDALLKAEIGVDVKESCEAVKARAEVAKPQPTLSEAMQGNKNAASEKNSGNNITPVLRGTNADYLTARIARDNPDILERMKAGEFKSVRQSAPAKTIHPIL